MHFVRPVQSLELLSKSPIFRVPESKEKPLANSKGTTVGTKGSRGSLGLRTRPRVQGRRDLIARFYIPNRWAAASDAVSTSVAFGLNIATLTLPG